LYLRVFSYDGAKLGEPYQAPEFTGPAPVLDDVEDAKTYTGSCHCGAVKVALKSTPLDETYTDRVLDCNCSVCNRVSSSHNPLFFFSPFFFFRGVCVYERERERERERKREREREREKKGGGEHSGLILWLQGGYVWVYPKKSQSSIEGAENLTGVWGKAFCKTCGVHFMNERMPLTDAEFAALPEKTRVWIERVKDVRPLTLRMLDDFDLASVKATQADGWNDVGPKYVNP